MVDGHLAKSVRPHSFATGEGEPDIVVGIGTSGIVRVSGSAEAVVVEITDQDMEVARDLRGVRRSEAPTTALVRAHELHNAEYREWCHTLCGWQRCLSPT